MPAPIACPSCRATMTKLELPALTAAPVLLDACFACRGFWFDPQENLRLAPDAVVALFRQLHAHRDEPQHPLAHVLHCPRCPRPLQQGMDVVKTGRYVTYRCPAKHGRFAPFASFLIEKGFVRQLTTAEVDDMARRVSVVHCSSCGAPVNVRQDAVCAHCRSPLSLLDPQAVERALQGYAQAAARARWQLGQDLSPELNATLARLQREHRPLGQGVWGLLNAPLESPDLWKAGLVAVWSLLSAG